MPKPISEYSTRDLLHFRPVLDLKREVERAVSNAINVRAREVTKAADCVQHRIGGQHAIFTIAFNHPDVIALQIELVRRFIPSAMHVVVDNSTDDRAAAEISKISAAASGDYVRLPGYQWANKGPNVSHGTALNWTWRNLIRAAKPTAFGFIDHDLFPMSQTNPFSTLADYPISGVVLNSVSDATRWHLWAGFCFFRYSFVQDMRLDFGPDYLAGLDTGGRNWRPLYRQLSAAQVPDPGSRDETMLVDGKPVRMNWVGQWLHQRAYSYAKNRELKAQWVRDAISRI